VRNLPTGTVSFLFSDIEGSTELLQRLGDTAYGEVLTEHHRLMRGALEEEDGVEVGTQGDAFFVAFPRAWNAVSAAMAAQQAFAAHAWPEGVTINVRMGLHTGEPTIDETGYVGLDVHRGARLCSAAHGGQILLSERTYAMTLGALSEGAGVKDLGDHRLKDLVRPEHIFQLVIEGLPSDFPPLRSLEILKHNLPSLQLTSFIGREREIAETTRLLTTARLLTLMGSGGSGKTRLALQVAGDLVDTFPQGVWLVELASLSDPDLVPQTVASVFGVREVPGRTRLDTLVEYFRPRELLLVLDNCEHLVEACGHLAATLLRGCSKLRILATSREPLGAAGEVTYRLPPLSSPDSRRRLARQQLMEFEAVRLFVERALQSNPAFALTDTNAPAVAHICHQLDGIPLAIELAAARVNVLSVEQIAQRLDDRFRLLSRGARTGLPQHQTLRATVDWSYELLTEPERVLFQRLSAFSGGFMLDAVEAVCAGDGIPIDDILDLLARLVDKSLVIAETLNGDVRYRMLETIRQYSRERLTASDEADTVRRRHLEWFVRLAERAEPELHGPEQITWLDRLETEHDNLRAALDVSKTPEGGAEAVARLAGAVHRFWALRGHLREGREWFKAISAGSASLPAGVRAKALYAAGTLAFDQGDYAQAATLCEAGLTAYRASGEAAGIALSLNVLGMVARNRGDYARASTLLEESLALSRSSGQRWALAEALNILGVTARRQGDYARATALCEESLLLWREQGDKWGLAASLGHLAVVARFQGEYERALALHEESLALRKELGDRRYIAAALASLGVVARHLGDYDRASTLLDESLALSRELGDRPSIVATLCSLGFVAHRQGDDTRASEILRESLGLARELGDKLNSAAALCNLGFVACRQSHYEQAAAQYGESLKLYRELGDAMGLADCLVGLASLIATRSSPELAVQLLGGAEALREARSVRLPPSDRTDYERSVVAIRALLSEDAFARAWAQGRAMPLDEVIQLGASAGALPMTEEVRH